MYQEWICPDCGTALTSVLDYIAGGSHYWTLSCPDHGIFYFDTYAFTLSRKQDIVAFAVERGIDRLVAVAALAEGPK